MHLVDTDGRGVERITARGPVVAGVQYEVDCIIYASGFEVGSSYERRAGFDLEGRGGRKLSDEWADGMLKKREHVEKTYQQVLDEKLIAFIKEQVSIDEKTVSLDEFKNLNKQETV